MRARELYDAFTAEPPSVHRARYRDLDDDEVLPDGAWDFTSPTQYTASDCYDLIEAYVGDGAVTLETGLGLSTVLFAALGCDHQVLFLDEQERAPLCVWADAHNIDMSGVDFVVGPSDESLRRLDPRPVDLFLIDGGHGFPLPILDWFYGAGRVKHGGLVVLDDMQLWAPRQLDAFLDADPRWEQLARTTKWSAYRRLNEGPIAEDFDAQAFLPTRRIRPVVPEGLNWKGRFVYVLPEPVRLFVVERLHRR